MNLRDGARNFGLMMRLLAFGAVCVGSAHCAMADDPAEEIPVRDGGHVIGSVADGGVRDGADNSADASTPPVEADAATPLPMGTPGVLPAYLPNRRTYDQERDYVAWTGNVQYVTLTHRDNTSLPESEGGTSCGSTCSEQVTRIGDGASIHGNFAYLAGFRVQLASESADGVGQAIVEACGQEVGRYDLAAGSGTAGFNNFPLEGAWPVPTEGACEWSIRAVGGFVDVRAVTPTYRTSSAPPAVDLRVNESNGPITLEDPADFVLSWSSSNAISCVASGAWSGGQETIGAHAVMGTHAGHYTYTIRCENSLGVATDSVEVNVQAPPG